MQTANIDRLQNLARLVRRRVLEMSARAGSGHPTSALSAADLMTCLFFGGVLRYDAERPEHPNNDRVIFSKGHASPLLYALWHAAGRVSLDELMTYRTFGSLLEGHPTRRFPYAEAATGSLGQGLSIGVGMALNAQRFDELPYRTWVLLGDSEMAEGSQWEAVQLAAHYKLANLVGILDVNRLGQRGETMVGRDLDTYRRRLEAFGWSTIVVEDGHDHAAIVEAYNAIDTGDERPTMLIAGTVKGKGVSFVEDENGWHGKAIEDDKLEAALEEIGEVDASLRGDIAPPESKRPATRPPARQAAEPEYKLGDTVATRNGLGNALARLAPAMPELVVLDGEVCNSTRTKFFRDACPERYVEMFIAEQNMVGAGAGLALRGRQVLVSSFAAFLTRAFDQARMAVHSEATLKFAGSHAGVSIGQDGPSQMGLEDLAMFRAIAGSVVFYPCDAMSAERLTEAMLRLEGVAYIRTTRGKTPVIYGADERFEVGGSKTLRRSGDDRLTLVSAGYTLHEALEAYERLKADGAPVRVIDLYSVKPVDADTLREAAQETGALVVIEDHYPQGGLADAVREALAGAGAPVHSLAVTKRPLSGSTDDQLAHQGLSARGIVEAAKRVMTADRPRPATPR